MKQNKLETISNLFEGSEIRSIWDSETVKLVLFPLCVSTLKC